MSIKIESTVTLKCKEGKINEFKQAISELVRETVKEDGCELFRIFQKIENHEEFILWEIFKDKEALELHMKKEYTQKIFSLNLFDVISAIHHKEIN